MADFNQFGSATHPQSGDAHHCAQCEAMLADALDGTLSAADQAAFDLHMVGCDACSTMLAEAQRGLAWMELLKSSQPEPSASLVERILAQTSNQSGTQPSKQIAPAIVLGPTDRLRTPNTLLGRPLLVPTHAHPAAFASTNVLPFRTRIVQGFRSLGQTMLQPRLAMTAAMAFFSIALTMNLTGVRLSELHASDLKPSSLKRSFYEANAHVVSYYYNLRVVYELESRVRDLQRSTNDDSSTSTPASQSNPAASPQKPAGDQQPDDQKPGTQNQDQKQTRPRPGPGSSRREDPGTTLLLDDTAHRPGSRLSSTQFFVVFPPSVFKEKGGLV